MVVIPPDLESRLRATASLHPGLWSKIQTLSLRQDALAKNAYGTAAMEGNRLSLEEVRDLLAPRFRRQILELVRETLARADG